MRRTQPLLNEIVELNRLRLDAHMDIGIGVHALQEHVRASAVILVENRFTSSARNRSERKVLEAARVVANSFAELLDSGSHRRLDEPVLEIAGHSLEACC